MAKSAISSSQGGKYEAQNLPGRWLIALMTEAARTSETSVDIQLRTRQYIPEDSELHMAKSFSSFFLESGPLTCSDS
jgi:hypothetical protein